MSINRKDFDSKYLQELTFDDPIRAYNFSFFPVKVKDYFKFIASSSVLKIKKDRSTDARIISMTYNEYLANLLAQELLEKDKEEKIVLWQIYTLFGLVLRDESLDIRPYVTKRNKLALQINGVPLTGKQFDDIKDIILFQNDPNYTGIELNEDLENELEVADRLRSHNKVLVDMERQILSLVVGTGMDVDSIKNLSIRKFSLLQKMKNAEIEYKINRTGEVGGMVKFKEQIQHFLTEDEKDPFDDRLMNYAVFKGMFGQ